ncbi:hypothetical protein Glove_102g39 [Diversispora epigaea]|uniref:Uncharacterized protein n=1 Tax=Diversispora epigaea TaxID=1348612 RepID=A0A397JAC4_9GLOM|nr:hypothetical protein Glove_102g39 [Diversispora epigaea]
MLNSNKAMFHIGLIPSRWYNDVTFDPRKELSITICSEKTRPNDDKNIYEHQVRTNFDLLNKIHHTHLFSETVWANLSHKAKYNLGFGYAKQAIGLALELGCEDEINKILRNWINEKKIEIRDSQPDYISNKENLSSALRKRVKNAVEIVNKCHEKNNTLNELSRNENAIQTKYICSFCKGVGHNSRSFGYAKQAIGLALELGCEDEINKILRNWINEKKIEIRDSQPDYISNKENLSSALRKRVKNAVEIVNKCHEKNNTLNELSRNENAIQTKYICSFCKGVGHNSRSCSLKKR